MALLFKENKFSSSVAGILSLRDAFLNNRKQIEFLQ